MPAQHAVNQDKKRRIKLPSTDTIFANDKVGDECPNHHKHNDPAEIDTAQRFNRVRG